jgi:hypothetical protein
MKILPMTLQKKWFDMVISGNKKEEYREIKDYWARRFLFSKDEVEWQVWEEMLHDMKDPFLRHNGPSDLMQYFGVAFRDYQAIHFVNGYGKTRPSIDVAIENITINRGKKEWGAEEDHYYFVFQLGKLMECTEE